MVNTARTAIVRKKLSAPMAYLYENSRTFMMATMVGSKMLDYGCGKGFDEGHFGMDKYDPNHEPWTMDRKVSSYGTYDLITCNYVLNVIPEEQKRMETLFEIHSLLRWGGVAYISVRDDRANLNGYTKINTWQGFVELDRSLYAHKKGAFRMYRIVKGDK